MSYIDKFKKRMFRTGDTIQEQITYEAIESFKEYVEDAPNYFKVKINGDSELIITDLSKEYGCTIQDIAFNDKKSLDEKLLSTFNETPIRVGKYVQWYEDYWIVVFEEERTIKSHLSMVIRPCNNTLKWIDKNGYVRVCPCIIDNQTLYSDGLNEGTDITLLDTKKSVVIPYNEVTKDLEEQQRFLFNSDKRYCYQLSQFDELPTKGIINLTLTQSEYNASTDDLANNLCNIKQLADYKIQILSILNNAISCKKGDSVQLNYQLLLSKNGEQSAVTDANLLNQITFSCSNNSIATVNNKGLINCIDTGDCEITITFNDGFNIVTEKISLHIIEESVNNFQCKLIGKDKLVIGGKSTYSIEFYDTNGEKITNPCNFILKDENGNPTNLATINKVQGQQCTIFVTSDVKMIGKCFILKAESLDKSVSDSIKIKITSVFG